jgi:hypothetical protein
MGVVVMYLMSGPLEGEVREQKVHVHDNCNANVLSPARPVQRVKRICRWRWEELFPQWIEKDRSRGTKFNTRQLVLSL